MAETDGAGHPLTLKVMRVSRPHLASNWQPFFSTSPSLSAHATASPLTLQGTEPLPGHPKTLRDLTVASPFLTLPSSFGTIQLGETFSCVLSVNNEASVPVDEVTVRVEMQTSTSKVLLEERKATEPSLMGEAERNTLAKGNSLEVCVSSEIKEIGQHVLACSLSYRTPPGMQPASSSSADPNDPFVQSFRKFYKFMVTNPLSVKTKIHVPKSPTALLSERERDKVFLEAHIQNLTPGPLWFERISLEAVDGWDVVDANVLSMANDVKETRHLFSDSMALMHAQDMRQYIYILTPKSASRSKIPVPPAPGTIIPLGRLDICWRSSMGEPGRLLTSVLSRRIPVPAPSSTSGMPSAPPASAVPPYLQKSISNQPRPRSPSLQQRSGTPPPASPIKRSTTPGVPPRPQSPGIAAPPVPSLPKPSSARAEVEADIVLVDGPADAAVRLGEPFAMKYRIAVSGQVPAATQDLLGQQTTRRTRFVSLAVQHVVPDPNVDRPATGAMVGPPAPTLKRHGSRLFSMDGVPSSPGIHSPSSHTGSIDMLTPRRVVSPPPGGAPALITVPSTGGGEVNVSSPSTSAPNRGLTVGGLEERLRRIALSEALGVSEEDGRMNAFGEDDEDFAASFHVRLPLPYKSASVATEEKSTKDKGSGVVHFLGSSAVFLPPIELKKLEGAGPTERGEGFAEVTLTYYSKARGFASVGGLRVLLVKDEEKLVELQDDGDSVTLHPQGHIQQSEATIVREWDVIAELWVR